MGDELRLLEENVAQFKAKNRLERLVMANLTSTEKFCELTDAHLSIEAFEKGIDANDENISPLQRLNPGGAACH